MSPTPFSVSLLMLSALLLVAVPAGAAYPECVDAATQSLGPAHVIERAVRSELWAEENDLPGLQTTTCHADGLIYPHDRFVVQVLPQDLGIIGLCTTYFMSQCF